MVYVRSWQRFQIEVTQLYEKSPENTRYTIKFRAKEGILVLKVTDDTKVITHKTSSSVILNRFEQLNRHLLTKMMNLAPAPALATLPAGPTVPSARIPEGPRGMEGVESSAPSDPLPASSTTAGAPTGASSKKKKSKGKKK